MAYEAKKKVYRNLPRTNSIYLIGMKMIHMFCRSAQCSRAINLSLFLVSTFELFLFKWFCFVSFFSHVFCFCRMSMSVVTNNPVYLDSLLIDVGLFTIDHICINIRSILFSFFFCFTCRYQN